MIKKYFYGIQNNIWKYFVFLLTGRRNFIPVLFLYYLTLPNANIVEISIITSVGIFSQFALEIPSGYISDIVGHKKTLILNKLFLVFSMLCFILANGFWIFLLGFIFMHIGMALGSGTKQAFLHETLKDMKQDNLYTKISGRIGGIVSLISAICIFTLPFFTNLSYIIPIIIWLFFDIIGLVVSFSFVNPNVQYKVTKTKKITNIVKELGGKQALVAVILFTIFLGIGGTDTPFRYLYLEELGYMVKRIGAVMGFSRIVRFVISRYIHKIELLGIKKVMILEMIFFPLLWFLAARLNNPYMIGILLSIKIGIFRGFDPIFTKYIIDNIPDKKYKATMLSIKEQGITVLKTLVIFGIGFIMEYSFKLGYIVLASLTFILLGGGYLLVNKFIKSK